MKPISLNLKNIGPFRDEKINFEELGEMFLICGKTGSGKTTIFDAMTYAIYGSLPGARASLNSWDLRSHFAKKTDEAFIEFSFLLKGENIYIKRTLPQQHTTRQNKISEKQEELFVSIKNRNSEKILEGTPASITKQLIAMIGLTVNEFSLIVLLPQGEFADFLKQKSSEKSKTLAKLFPIQQYTDIINYTNEKLKLITEQRKNICNQLEQDFPSDFNHQKEKEIIQEQENEIKEIEKNEEKIQEKISIQRKKCDQYQNFITKLNEYNKYKQKNKDLESQRYDIENKNKRLQLAIKAEPVFIAIKQKQEHEHILNNLKNQLKEKTLEQTQLEQKLSLLLKKDSEIQETKIQQKNFEALLKEVEISLETEQKLIKKISSILELENKIKQEQEVFNTINQEKEKFSNHLKEIYQKDIEDIISLFEKLTNLTHTIQDYKKDLIQANEKEEIQKNVLEIENNLQSQTDELEICKEKIENTKKQIEKIKQENYAQILKETLTPGLPCPVCGIIHDPEKSKKANEKLEKNFENIQKELEENLFDLEKDFQKKSNKKAINEGQLFQLKERLEKLKNIQTSQEITNKLEKKQTEENITKEKYDEAKIIQEEINKLEKELQNNLEESRKIENKIQQLKTELKYEKESKETLEKDLEKILQKVHNDGIESSNIQEILDILDSKIKHQENEIRKYSEEKYQLEMQQEKLKGFIDQQKKDITTRQTELNKTQENVSKNLTNSGFNSIEEVELAVLNSNEKTELEKEIYVWTQENIQTETLLLKTKEEVNSFSNFLDLQENLENNEIFVIVQNRFEIEQKILTELEEQHSTSTKNVQQLILDIEQRKNHLKSWHRLDETRNSLIKAETLHQQLYNDIAGKRNKKIPLHTWVLGIYLDEITTYASNRLNRISEGRYTLLLNQEKTGGNGEKGLDLEILDAYTGKKRPCSSLSGGETFMASISLALALTDVISNRTGGISLESLFIDEGFGSLDETSLEKALSTLEEIRENRCIGLISHISEMKRRIPAKLEIKKTTIGSKTKIIFTE